MPPRKSYTRYTIRHKPTGKFLVGFDELGYTINKVVERQESGDWQTGFTPVRELDVARIYKTYRGAKDVAHRLNLETETGDWEVYELTIDEELKIEKRGWKI